MLAAIKSLIRARMPLLAFWIGRLRRWHANRTDVRVPEIDRQAGDRPRLLIDVTHTSKADYLTGIQRVVLRLSRELLNQSDRIAFEPVPVRLDTRSGITRLVETRFDHERLLRETMTSDQPVRLRRNDIFLMLDSSWDELAIFAKYIFPVLKTLDGKVVTCLYDLIPLTHPEFCDAMLVHVFRRWMPKMLCHSDAVLCISQATQTSLQTYLRDNGLRFTGRIDHFHLGADFANVSDIGRRADTGMATVLMVGTLEPRKGLHIALAAFEVLWKRNVPIRLRIIGRFGWSVHDLVDEIQHHPRLGTQLVLQMSVSDAELRQAYKDADLVASASLVEGFGLPLVEAAALGKSLIVSDIAAYREVCGTNAIYFEAGHADDLADKLEHWFQTRDAPKPPEFLSWSESAAQAAKRIDNMLTNPRRSPDR